MKNCSPWFKKKFLTIINVCIRPDRPEQSAKFQIRMWQNVAFDQGLHICHSFSNILETSIGNKMDLFKF